MPEAIVNRRRSSRWMLALGVLGALLLNALYVYVAQTQPFKPTILERILAEQTITLITRNTSHSYYLYRGQAMGFEYDLARAFADHLGVALEVVTIDDWQALVPALMQTETGFIAAGLVGHPAAEAPVLYSDGYMAIQQHILVHRNNRHIRTAADLAGHQVHVRRGSPYHRSLETLRQEGIAVDIKLYDDIPTEEFIRQVALGTIHITIANRNIALLNRRYYPQLVISGAITDTEDLCWAVHPEARELLERVNRFWEAIEAGGQYDEIYNRYYANAENFNYVDLRAFHRRLKSRLPKYKDIIVKSAERYGFDWRLIAAQAYQESHFNPYARSHAGAYGLMQLTRATAESLGVTDIYDPAQNIRAGTRHLKYLFGLFDQADEVDRLLLALAAYNVGTGHVLDARSLARQMNLDPDRWESVAQTLPLLRLPKYYKNATYGYCRGTEPIQYIQQILIYYDILKYKEREAAQTAKFPPPEEEEPPPPLPPADERVETPLVFNGRLGPVPAEHLDIVA